jgi:hypothetical protein
VRYRKAVTYGHQVLLAALEEHVTPTAYEVVFAESAAATVEAIRAARAAKVLVLGSFYSPAAEALAEELATIKAAAPGAVHVAGGVHATAEPVRTLDAGWDIAAVGEGESTLLALVDGAGDPTGIQGLVYRDDTGALVRTGKAHREPLGRYRAFPLTYKRMNRWLHARDHEPELVVHQRVEPAPHRPHQQPILIGQATMRKWIAVAAAALLSGCAGPASDDSAVGVAPYQLSSVPFDSLKDFVAQRPIIATGKVVAVNESAYEVPVDAEGEGNVAGEGPEIYGTVSFKVDSVIKGDIKPGSTLTIVYMSGKWNKADKKGGRIAYTHEKMASVQKADAKLKSPSELDSTTFAIFAAPKPASLPVKAADLYVAGIATVDGAGQLGFAGDPPFVSKTKAAVNLDDVKAAVA